MHGDTFASAARALLSPARADDRALCFDSDPTACFLVMPDARLKVANAAGNALIDDGVLHLDPIGRLCLGHARSRRLVDTAGSTSPAVHVHAIDPCRWLVLSHRRLPDRPDTIFVRVRDIPIDCDLDMSLVADRFGLTGSERPVLERLARAICPKDISRQLNLSIHTIRSHLRSIYAKMGAHSAAEAQTAALRLYYVITLSSELN